MMSPAVEAHSKECDQWDGTILEDAVASCILNATTGECERHLEDDTPIVRYCNGCSKEIERFRRVTDNRATDLKEVLMNLGNRLVAEHRYQPSSVSAIRSLHAVSDQTGGLFSTDDTSIISLFTEWINRCPDAQKILLELGIDWPVVEGP